MTSPIPPAAQQVLHAQRESVRQQIDVSLLKKQLDTQQHAGDALNELLEQAADLQQQLRQGRLDVRA